MQKTKTQSEQQTQNVAKVVTQQKAVEVLLGSVQTTKTNATRFLEFGLQNKYTKTQIANEVFNTLKSEGVGLNVKGKQIKLNNLKSQLSAFLNCIKTQRKGWWSSYTVTETEGIVNIIKKVE
jgi:hypothetical protein